MMCLSHCIVLRGLWCQCLFTSDADFFDHLAKMVFGRFLSTMKSTILFVLKKYWVKGILWNYPSILLLLKCWPNFSTYWWLLSTRFYYYGFCLIMTSFPLINCNALLLKKKHKKNPVPFPHFWTQLFVSAWLFILFYGLKANIIIC